MKKIKDIPNEDRPREKLLKNGASSLTDQELIAIILGRGTKGHDVLSISRKLVNTIDNGGTSLNVEDILRINGIGTAKATSISAAFEFVRRRIKPEGLKITTPVDVLPQIQHYSDRKQEHFLCLSINGANEVLNIRVVTIGLIDQSQVHPREIFADVIADRASAVIIAHNHPAGNVKPSEDDVEITKKIMKAASTLGIALLDHIIFNKTDYYSFLENNAL